MSEAPLTPPGRGLFLSLDGPDGSGKSTQTTRLVAWLRAEGQDVVACRDPGGTALGDRLRALLLDHNQAHVPIGLRAEMLLYMASRAQLVDEVIRPALGKGQIVVSDRYLLANIVYQGHAGGLPVEDVRRVGLVATGGVLPDLTLVLDVPPEVAAARVAAPRDRMEARPAAYHHRVRQGFQAELREYPGPCVLIDASADPDTVAAQIQSEVARALARRSGT
jgi:dTMP kinase